MKRRMICLAPIAWAALYVAAVPHAQAAFVATFSEVAGNVVVNGIGTLDLVDLSFGSVAEEVPTLIATPAFSILGHGAFSSLFFPITGPLSLGPGTGVFGAASGSGDIVGIEGNSVTSVLVVPHDYSSGTLLSDTTTFLDASFASLGLTPGTYVYGWGSGADADTFTIDIGAVPEPSTWALLLLGFGGLGFAGYKRARGQQSPLA